MRHFILHCLTLLIAVLPAAAQRSCASHEYSVALRAANPAAARGIADAEAFQADRTARLLAPGAGARLLSNGVIEIPVVVHVLYNNAA
ncbi:MAG: hypothetical protein EOP50_05355, partial [Sphingobacteriales bacterium]